LVREVDRSGIQQDRNFFVNLCRCYHAPYYFVYGLHDRQYTSGDDDVALAIQENAQEMRKTQNKGIAIGDAPGSSTNNTEGNQNYLKAPTEVCKTPNVSDLSLKNKPLEISQPDSLPSILTEPDQSLETEAKHRAVDLAMSSDPFDDLESDGLETSFDENTSVVEEPGSVDGVDGTGCDDGDDDNDGEDDSDKGALRGEKCIERWQCVDGVGRVGPKQPH
jgi:hypothetical protein